MVCATHVLFLGNGSPPRGSFSSMGKSKFCQGQKKEDAEVRSVGSGSNPLNGGARRTDAVTPPFYRALFQTARFSAGRINEVLHLKWSHVYPDCIIIPKAITKKKVRTRQIPLHPTLKDELDQWRAKWPEVFGRAIEGTDYLFPSKRDLTKAVTRVAADQMLRAACAKAGYNGVSTHSFRRSALTAASDAGIPVRHIMELSGHSSLAVLQSYLSCTAKQKRACAMAFG